MREEGGGKVWEGKGGKKRRFGEGWWEGDERGRRKGLGGKVVRIEGKILRECKNGREEEEGDEDIFVMRREEILGGWL